ncbi:MAG: LPS assembly lipoprotein LptE [Candidatus Omnitrophica bacterium]|nr:LPS assembly lipoprotein LptE [Candidatus Omnitrophota bacterium]
MKYILSIVFACLVLTGGCGYTTRAILPENQKSIHVDNFVNGIDFNKEISNRRPEYSYWPGLETNITKTVIDNFLLDKSLMVKSETEADLLLKGTLKEFRQFPLSYDNNDNVEELRVEIYVDLELYDNHTNQLLWKESGFMGQTDYTVNGPKTESESEAVNAAAKDLSQRILERIVESW